MSIMPKAMRLLVFNILPLVCLSSNDYNNRSCSVELRKQEGPFDIALQSIKTCKGPKIKDCVFVTVKKQNDVINYEMNVAEDFNPTKAKIVASAKTRPTLRLQINNPCKHPFVRPFLNTLLNATDNCTILKGQYNLEVNIENTFRKYYGGSFLYGNWTFHSTLYSELCNFLCTIAVVELYPKSNSKSL